MVALATRSLLLFGELPVACLAALAQLGKTGGYRVVSLARQPLQEVPAAKQVQIDLQSPAAAQVEDIWRQLSDTEAAVIAAVNQPLANELSQAAQTLHQAVTGNCFAVFRLLEALVPRMISRGRGLLQIVTLDPAELTGPEAAATRASTQALTTYVESLRPALWDRGVATGVSLIAPQLIAANVAVAERLGARLYANLTHGVRQDRVVQL